VWPHRETLLAGVDFATIVSVFLCTFAVWFAWQRQSGTR
jgi:hypothetical protein